MEEAVDHIELSSPAEEERNREHVHLTSLKYYRTQPATYILQEIPRSLKNCSASNNIVVYVHNCEEFFMILKKMKESGACKFSK